MLEQDKLEKYFVEELKIIQDIIKRMAFRGIYGVRLDYCYLNKQGQRPLE